jgi:hypothetical protein
MYLVFDGNSKLAATSPKGRFAGHGVETGAEDADFPPCRVPTILRLAAPMGGHHMVRCIFPGLHLLLNERFKTTRTLKDNMRLPPIKARLAVQIIAIPAGGRGNETNTLFSETQLPGLHLSPIPILGIS